MSWMEKVSFVFGEGIQASDLQEYALRSDVKFVRSQDHLAVLIDENRPTKGHVLNAYEALEIFGLELLEKVTEEGIVAITCDIEEPAKSFKARREMLGLTQSELAKQIGVSVESIENLEDQDYRNPIKLLNMVSQKLGMDEKRISVEHEQSGERVAVRLKTISAEKKIRISQKDLLTLSEASWVIMKQSELLKMLNKSDQLAWQTYEKDYNYGMHDYPAWKHGYYLADKLRRDLGIDQEIKSIRELCEGEFQIPLIHASLSSNIAGAIISIEAYRGIVVNINGANTTSVFSKRLTIAHELGHLLWDPDEFLEDLRLDEYDTLDGNFQDLTDRVERRANAFSIQFLAPQDMASEVYKQSESPGKGLENVMRKFGVSLTAAKYHLQNYEVKVPNHFEHVNVRPSDEWKSREDFSLDYVPINEIPNIRRGLFSGLVAAAYKLNYISSSTASFYLGCEQDVFEEKFHYFIDLFSDELEKIGVRIG